MYQLLIKPTFDFLGALFLLVLLSPIFLIVLVVLAVSLKGNPFFTQPRPGKNEVIFKIYKFKTMNDAKDKFGNLLADNQRLTSLGKIIRKLSLDELPQLYNILKGDISFIGPRPLLIEYLPLYNEKQRKRHSVKPGISGWAQVNGRNAISWEDRFNLDFYYINNISFFLDLNIFFLTIYKILKSEGISSETTLTMEKFQGSKKIPNKIN